MRLVQRGLARSELRFETSNLGGELLDLRFELLDFDIELSAHCIGRRRAVALLSQLENLRAERVVRVSELPACFRLFGGLRLEVEFLAGDTICGIL